MSNQVFGIDQGNGNIKTKNTVFPCGFTKQKNEPSKLFGEEVIYYERNYYILSHSRFEYEIDKTKNDNCFILTLFAIAKEVKEQIEKANRSWKDYGGFVGKDIILALGLPPAHFEKQVAEFKKYFEKKFQYGVKFEYDGKLFDFHVKDIKIYPQCYAGAMILNQDTINKYKRVYIIDIGEGTVDLLSLREGAPEKESMASREIGISRLRNKIIDDVINDFAYTLDSEIIDDVLAGKNNYILDIEIEDKIKEEAERWTCKIVDQLHTKIADFRNAPTIFLGGGSTLLKEYLSNNAAFKEKIFNENISANAVGYEQIALMELSEKDN